MPVTTSQNFLEVIKSSDLLSDEEYSRAVAAAEDAADSKIVAGRLIKEGLISRWQASQLLKGRTKLTLGKYVLIERLAWGGSGAVFLAEHPMMNRKVALRVLVHNRSKNSDSQHNFLQAARNIASLDHRHLIHVFDVDAIENRFYLVMEYVPGRNLAVLVNEHGPVSPEVAADFLRQAAQGLGHVHSRGMVHAGIRPESVMVDDQGLIKILDVGVASLSDEPHAHEDEPRDPTDADYLAPEQADGGHQGEATDIYALGCLGYFLLTGKAPFAKGNFTQRMQRHTGDPVPDVRKANKSVPTPLAKLLYRMMQKDPDKRLATAAEVVEKIDKWWEGYEANRESEQSQVTSDPLTAKPPPPRKSKSAEPREKAASKSTEDLPNVLPNRGNSTAATSPLSAAAPPPKKKPNSSMSASAAEPAETLEFATADDATQGTAFAISTAPKGKRWRGEKKQKKQKKAAETSPTEQQPDAQVPDAEADTPVEAAEKPSKRWLFLAIGGGLFAFLMLVGGAVGAYLIFGSGDEKVAALENSVDEAAETNDDKVASGDEGEDEEPSSGEEKSTDEKGQDEPAEDSGEPDANAAGQGEDDEAAVEGQEPDDSEDNANPDDVGEPDVEAEPEDMSDPDTPSEETDPEPQSPDTSEPAEPKKPPKPVNPFKAIAAATELPEIDTAGPVSLGPVALTGDQRLFVDMLAGDKAGPKGEGYELQIAGNGLAENRWEFTAADKGGENTIIAKLGYANGSLDFEWTPEAKSVEGAGNLRNSMLELRTSEATHQLALRKPVELPAIPIQLDRPVAKQEIEIDNLPDAENLHLEIVGLEGEFQDFEMKPSSKISIEQGSTYMLLGPADKRFMALKIDANSRKGKTTLVVSPQLITPNKPVKLNVNEVSALGRRTVLQAQQLQAQLEQAKKRKAPKKTVEAMQVQLNEIQQQVMKFDEMGVQYEKLNGKAQLNYRLFYSNEINEVDLAKSVPAVIEDGVK